MSLLFFFLTSVQGKVPFNEFVKSHLGTREGAIVEFETGKELGKHEGYWFHTVGQRKGLKLSGGPWYVVGKNVADNIVYVSNTIGKVMNDSSESGKHYEGDKEAETFQCDSLNWISGAAPAELLRSGSFSCYVKVRHGPEFYPCTLAPLYPQNEVNNTSVLYENTSFKQDGHEKLRALRVTLSHSYYDQGIAGGQYAAFYKQNVCLGCGIIRERDAAAQYSNYYENRKAQS